MATSPQILKKADILVALAAAHARPNDVSAERTDFKGFEVTLQEEGDGVYILKPMFAKPDLEIEGSDPKLVSVSERNPAYTCPYPPGYR